eukprot:30401-Pelagococcus_subviridis.AAC.1
MGGETRAPGEKVLKKRRSPRRRGRTGTSVNQNAPKHSTDHVCLRKSQRAYWPSDQRFRSVAARLKSLRARDADVSGASRRGAGGGCGGDGATRPRFRRNGRGGGGDGDVANENAPPLAVSSSSSSAPPSGNIPITSSKCDSHIPFASPASRHARHVPDAAASAFGGSFRMTTSKTSFGKSNASVASGSGRRRAGVGGCFASGGARDVSSSAGVAGGGVGTRGGGGGGSGGG